MDTNMRKNPSKHFFSFFSLLSLHIIFFIVMAMAQNTTFIPVNVGVGLDLDYLDGKIGLSCIDMSISDFYATHANYKTRLLLTTRDSKKDVVGAALAAMGLIENLEVQAIIEPTTSMQGVLGVTTCVPRWKGLKDFRVWWKRKFQQDNPDTIYAEFSIYGIWAYDAATASVSAVEKAGTRDLIRLSKAKFF